MKENRLIWSFHLSILALISQVQYDAWVIVFRITPDRPKVFLIRFHLYSSDLFGGIAETTWTSFLLGFLLGWYLFVISFRSSVHSFALSRRLNLLFKDSFWFLFSFVHSRFMTKPNIVMSLLQQQTITHTQTHSTIIHGHGNTL